MPDKIGSGQLSCQFMAFSFFFFLDFAVASLKKNFLIDKNCIYYGIQQNFLENAYLAE